jgi:hypothetical protein
MEDRTMRPWRIVAWAAVMGITCVHPLHAGVDVTWNDCVGGTPATNKNFVCTGATNQNYTLIFQFKTQQDMPSFVALSARVDLAMPGPLCPFWHFEPGGCNAAPVGVAISDAMPASCAASGYSDPWNDGSDGFETIASYVPDFHQPGIGRFLLRVVRSEPIPVVAGNNYYAFHLRFTNRNRNGCEGCSQGGNVLIGYITLESNDGQPPMTLTGPDKLTDCAGINGAPCVIGDPCPPFCVNRALGTGCGPTGAEKSTWGILKMLYR